MAELTGRYGGYHADFLKPHIKSQAKYVQFGYGQVEPNHLSAQRTAQVYAQLPANKDIKVLEQGQFVKYDYAANENGIGEVNFTGAGEWMLVYNEIKLYREEQWDCEFALRADDFHARFYTPYDWENTENEKLYRAKCKYNDCCRVNCNGDEGCLHQCCVHECSEICSADENSEVCRTCWGTCPDPKGDYIYRSINMNRPFPNGTDANGRAPGKNWSGKVQYITKANNDHTIYYDATSGFNDDFEYSFEFTSDQLQMLKEDYNDNSKMYSIFYESKKAKNYSNEKVYCSSIIHEYLKSKNVKVSGNRITNKVGSGCEVK